MYERVRVAYKIHKSPADVYENGRRGFCLSEELEAGRKKKMKRVGWRRDRLIQ